MICTYIGGEYPGGRPGRRAVQDAGQRVLQRGRGEEKEEGKLRISGLIYRVTHIRARTHEVNLLD